MKSLVIRFVPVALLVLSLAPPAFAVRPSTRFAADPRSTGVAYTDVSFPSSRDSVPLHGWWFAPADSAPVVVVCPTSTGNMADRLGSVREWARRGYRVLAFDLREFGPAGPGPVDSLDRLVFASRWVNDTEGALIWARSQAQGRPVIAWGQDLGSALAIAAAARNKGNADALVLEGVFRTSQEQLLWLGTSQDPQTVRDHRRLVYPIDEPLSAAGRLRLPVFAVLAGKDELTPPDPTRQVIQRIMGPRELWPLPDAKHDNVAATPGYFDRITTWLGRTFARTNTVLRAR